jgi:ribose transport system permease protein
VVLSASSTAVNTQVVSTSLTFDVILVVVIGGVSLHGGRGRIRGVVVATLLIGVLLNGLTILDVNSEAQNIVKGVLLLAAILLDNRLHPRDEETARQGDM